MTKDEALKLALEALEYPLNQSHENFNVDMAELLAHKAVNAIKKALAQPEQEPVACPKNIGALGMPVNVPVTPPQRTWVGLTEDELNMIGDSMRIWNSFSITDVYFAIAAKLKQKNGYAEEKNT